MINRIARIHLDGVKLELAAIGLNPKLDYEFFKTRWEKVGIGNVKTFPKGKALGFITKMDGETMLYVDKKHHRQGIGSALLNMETVKDVWVIDGNYRAEGFYKHHGFTKTTTQRVQEQFGEQVKETLYVKK